jgi:glycosyltransferase involved in cell wall biosynthesis
MVVCASVVIACRNGEAFLAETLEALTAQVWDRPWEIVFADNGSTDGSLAIFQACAARNPHLVMRSVDAGAEAGKSFALNCAVAAAASDAIIVCDADDIPAPGWLAALGDALGDHDFVAATIEAERLNTGPIGVYRHLPVSTWELPFAPFSTCTGGGIMGFSRRLFDAVGGFSTAFKAEDDEFCIRAHLAGFTLHIVPEAVLHYRLRRDLTSIFAQAYRYSSTEVKVARTYRAFGPAQRKPWRKLARQVLELARDYARLRLRPKGIAEEAKLRWRLGAVAGQIAGVVRHLAPPTTGLPPAIRPAFPVRVPARAVPGHPAPDHVPVGRAAA